MSELTVIACSRIIILSGCKPDRKKNNKNLIPKGQLSVEIWFSLFFLGCAVKPEAVWGQQARDGYACINSS